MENKILIERLIARDETAFKELVFSYKDMIINTCYGFLHNYQDAQDVAQDVFIEVHRSISKFRKEAKLSTWLYRISVNKSLNYIRDNKKKELFNSLDLLFDNKKMSVSNSNSPLQILEKKEQANIINEAVDKLKNNQKTAFILSKYQNLSYQEIADVMKLSISSVESLLFRAKKKLQKLLINYYNSIKN